MQKIVIELCDEDAMTLQAICDDQAELSIAGYLFDRINSYRKQEAMNNIKYTEATLENIVVTKG